MPLDLTIETETETTKRHCVTLNGDQVRALVRENGYPDLPETAQVTVRVPGGGDWSNMFLDIGVDTMLEVTWTVSETNRTLKKA